MATAVILPKLGNSVESSIIVRWMKQPGEPITAEQPICEIETDKATAEVVSPVSGIVLAHYYAVGDDVPVMTMIASVGAAGEPPLISSSISPAVSSPSAPVAVSNLSAPTGTQQRQPISPRARALAAREGLDVAQLVGSGPDGRLIERDIQAALVARPKLTPLARAMVDRGGYTPPSQGSGPAGRVVARDLAPPVAIEQPAPPAAEPDAGTAISISGIRRVIAERMRASLHTTAQLTMHTSADARQLQAYRKRLKASPEALGLRGVTLNDLILFVVARTLLGFPTLNATLNENQIVQHAHVQLGMAVDTPRGLLVPVIQQAEVLSLRALAAEAARLAQACQVGKATPSELSGGTFTVSNLGSLGIESFTPILNAPQVAILGVGSIVLRPVDQDGDVAFIPQLGLSLTIDHQAIDGAPAARFLQALVRNLAEIDLIVAL